MDLIPLIKMNNRKIFTGKNSNTIELKDMFSIIKNEKKIYILDFDGIKKDKPNLCTYQRVSGIIDFWVDSGPRDQGDVVDATMSGATDITLRKELCPKIVISTIKEITDNKIYKKIEKCEESEADESDGLVNFYKREEIEKNIECGQFLKREGKKNVIYAYEKDLENLNYWKYFNLQGLLVDLDKIEDFKNALRN